MKKHCLLILIFCFFSIFFVSNTNVFAESNFCVRVISNKTNVYKSLNFSDENIFDLSNIIFSAQFKTKFACISKNVFQKTITVKTKNINYNFYEINVFKYDEENGTKHHLNENNEDEYFVGFVLCCDVLNCENESLKIILDTNAKVSEKNDVCLYSYDFNLKQYVENETLLKGSKIKLIEGYNDNLEYTKIQYANSEGNICTAYVKTSNIIVSKISVSTICAVIVIVASISIVLIVLGKKRKHKKHKKH